MATDAQRQFCLLKEDPETTPSADYRPHPRQGGLLRWTYRSLAWLLFGRRQCVQCDVHRDAAEASRLAGLLADSVSDMPRMLFVAEGDRSAPVAAREARDISVLVHRTNGDPTLRLNGRDFYKLFRLLRLTYQAQYESGKIIGAPSTGLKEENECPCCMNEPADLVLSCGHSFCSRCLLQWSHDAAFTCPLCRRKHATLDDSFFLCEAPTSDAVAGTFSALLKAKGVPE